MSKIKGALRALPENPSLENLKKQARALHRSVRDRAPEAEARARASHPRAQRALPFEHARFSLSDAQLVLAREYGFESWPKLKAYVATSIAPLVAAPPVGVGAAELALPVRDTRALVDRLFERLELVARRIEWLSMPELARLRHAGDLTGLIAVGSMHCDPSVRQALLEALEPARLVDRLCESLEPLVRQPSPRPLSAPEGTPSERRDAAACLVVLHASGHPHLLGRCYPLTGPSTTIGRHVTNQVVIHSDSVSREHARIERRAEAFVLIDQKSTNGSFVNEAREPVSEHLLVDGDRVAIGDAILGFLSGPELDAKCRAAVDYIAQHDVLTRAKTRKAWLVETERQIFFARGDERALSGLLLEIDQLQPLSQGLGPLAGDALLLSVAQALREELGDQVLLGRCAEAQLAVALPDVDAARATELGERLRATLATRSLAVLGRVVTVTVSVGVATLYRTTGADELLQDALVALAQAKGAGGNAVRGPHEVAA